MSNALNVLYLDDSRTDREAVRRAFRRRKEHFRMVDTDSRAEFERHLQEGICDVVLTDFRLPGFDGLQVLDVVKSSGIDAPVVILTGSGSEEIAVRALKQGAADYVVKSPGEIERLPARLYNIIECHRKAERSTWAARDEGGQLQHLAAHGPAISERKALEKALTRQLTRLTSLIEVQAQLATAPDEWDVVMQVVVDRAQELCGADGAAIQFLEGERLVYRATTAGARYVRGTSLSFDRSISGQAVREGAALLCEDTETDPRVDREACRRTGVRAIIAAPMYHNDILVGVLRLYGLHPLQFGPRELELARLLAGMAGSEIQRRISEGRFRSLAELSADWYWEQDIQGRFSAISPSFIERTGMAGQQVIGRTRWELPGASPSVEERQAIDDAVAARQPFRDCGYTVRRADGAEMHVQTSGEPIFNVLGTFTGYRGVGRNISEIKGVELALRAAERFSTMTLDTLTRHICVLDERASIIAVNRAWREFAARNGGLEDSLLEGSNYLEACERATAADREDADRFASGIRAVLAGEEERFEMEYACHSPQEQRWFLARVTRFSDDGPVRIVIDHDNITTRKQAENALRQRAKQQGLIAAFGQQALATPDLDELQQQAMLFVTEGLEVEFGMALQLAPDGRSLTLKAGKGWDERRIGTTMIAPGELEPSAYLPSVSAPTVIEDFQAEERFRPWEIHIAHGITSGVEVLIAGNNGNYGVLGAYSRERRCFTPEDIDFMQSLANVLDTAVERKRNEEKLTYLAQFDALTGLPNRTLFHDRLSQTLVQAQRNLWQVGVLFVDLDGFKKVNDTLGHRRGDQLLNLVAGRLLECLRSGDTVARLSSDEFAIVLGNLARPDDAGLVATKIVAACARSFPLDSGDIFISASVGISLHPGDGAQAEQLLVNADIAMQRVKQRGRNDFQFFLPQMHERAVERAWLETQLRGALGRNEFQLHYQPKVDLISGQICGFEALLRWQHPQRGLVPPVQFISVLEETGLIIPVGEWIILEACRQIHRWQTQGLHPLPVAINLSALQFQRTDLDSVIGHILDTHGIDPHLLELELTESMLMGDAEEAARMLGKLKQRGLRLAVDDFGTGYSSLAYLKRFPLDVLKIDRAFVRDCTRDTEDAAIVLAVINLAHNLKLKVVAEGVETETQLSFLRMHGCDQIQGYYFSPPLPEKEISQALSEGRCLPPPAVEASAPGALSLLVVDDDPADLELFQKALAYEGYHLLTATDTETALDLLALHPVNVVISDQNMPGASGLSLLAKVRRLYPHAARALLMGADLPPFVAEAVNEAGIHKYLSKNWDPARLRSEVRDVCRTHLQSQEIA